MKLIVFLVLSFFFVQNISAQHIDVSVVQQGFGYNDSSYYDISKVSDSCFWVVGKYGILTELKTNGSYQKLNFPSMGTDLLAVDRFSDHNYIITADKGYVYNYNAKTADWRVQQIKGYENSCFYAVCIIDSLTGFICGGNSKIIRSKIAMPNGFILKTKDGGKSWAKSYSNKLNMVWDMFFDIENHTVYASLYKPNKTTIVAAAPDNQEWTKSQRKSAGLTHNIFKGVNAEMAGVGGVSYKTNKSGLYHNKSNNTKFAKSGLLWDYWQNQNFSLIAASKGCLLYKYNDKEWTVLNTEINPDYNLYEVKTIDESSVFVVGSGKTILRVNYKQ